MWRLLSLIILMLPVASLAQTKSFSMYGVNLEIPERSRIEDQTVEGDTMVLIDYHVTGELFTTMIVKVSTSKYWDAEHRRNMVFGITGLGDDYKKSEPNYNGYKGHFGEGRGMLRQDPKEPHTVLVFSTQKANTSYTFWVSSWTSNDTGLKASMERILSTLKLE